MSARVDLNKQACALSVVFSWPAETESENNLAFKTSRPIYGIILLLVSAFFMCTTFLPFLYSVVFPNENLQAFIAALEGREPPPLDSDTVVQQTIATVGVLKRTIRIGYAYQATTQIHYAEPRTTEKIAVSQAVNIAWFEKHPNPVLVAFACYERSDGQKAYGISEVSPFVVVREYAIPICFLGLSLFLARKRKPPVPPPVTTTAQESARDSHSGF